MTHNTTLVWVEISTPAVSKLSKPENQFHVFIAKLHMEGHTMDILRKAQDRSGCLHYNSEPNGHIPMSASPATRECLDAAEPTEYVKEKIIPTIEAESWLNAPLSHLGGNTWACCIATKTLDMVPNINDQFEYLYFSLLPRLWLLYAKWVWLTVMSS